MRKIELCSEQNFDVDVCIEDGQESRIVHLPAKSVENITLPDDSKDIHISFPDEEIMQPKLIRAFWSVIGWLVEILLIWLNIWDSSPDEPKEFGLGKENFLDTKIILKENYRQKIIKIIYKKRDFAGIDFNIVEVQDYLWEINYKYTVNKNYHRQVRMRMWAYIFMLLPISLFLIFLVVKISGGEAMLILLFLLIWGFVLCLNFRAILKERNKWKELKKIIEEGEE